MANWKTLQTVNLSSNADPNFKLARISENIKGVVFDLRQYNKGKTTKTGICLPPPETKWLFDCLQSCKTKSILEHNKRRLSFERSKDLNINITRGDGSERNITLSKEEETCLKCNINTLLTQMNKRALELGQNISFNNFEYVNEM
jgi:hypothetical protein